MRDYTEFLDRILFTEEDIQKRVKELGEQISRDYAGEDLLLVCILRGGVMFLTDLIRKISIPVAVEFMAVSSYGAGRRESSGHVRITFDLATDINNWHVLIIEDIVDSGHTLSSVLSLLQARSPKSLHVCTLLDKVERREVEIPIRYTGFVIPNQFVFGYGLDIDDFYRNLPFIATVDLQKFFPD